MNEEILKKLDVWDENNRRHLALLHSKHGKEIRGLIVIICIMALALVVSLTLLVRLGV